MQTYISTLPEPGRCAFPRKLCILGSTGSIGTSALKVVRSHPDSFDVVVLAGGRNAALLARQAAEFRPATLVVLDEATATELKQHLPQGYAPEIFFGAQAYVDVAGDAGTDMVLSSIVGAAGLPPTYAAVKAGKIVALANKESLVLAGELVREECARTGAVILPVDSEHNALFQAACFEESRFVDKLVLTASGGPFRGRDIKFLSQVTPAQALKHPNWDMGAKISIDSATLMNKGLEVIEACHLFGLAESEVETVVHPQSIIHSLAQFVDGSLLAHLGPPDMQIAIAYSLCYPERVPLGLEPVDLVKLGSLTFEAPDLTAFPCLRLAREAYRAGSGHCVVINAANEIAVELFLKGTIPFLDIPASIESSLEAYSGNHAGEPGSVDDILALDAATRARFREQWDR